MTGTIKERLDAGQLVRVMMAGGLASPKLVEAVGKFGRLHGVWFDQEHSAITLGDLEILTMACRAAGIDAFARVAPKDYTVVMQPLEAGCSGVMVAQIRTLEEVHDAVAWSKYAPQGMRGTFSATYDSGYGTADLSEHVARSNRERWLAIQIETTEAVEIVEQIAAVDGVDLVFVGPSDLSVNLGVPGELLHGKCVEALQRVSQACLAAGIPWGTLSLNVEHARQCRDLGCKLFSIYTDMGTFRRGIVDTEEAFAEFMD